MNNKKIFFGLFLFSLLGACTAPTAMLGPAYTLSATGNIHQAGLSFVYNEAITYYTGKTPIENIKKITLKEKNIPHDYTERPGMHNWDYFSNSVEYHILFFKRYFNKLSLIKNKI